jgi:hypothetical protein
MFFLMHCRVAHPLERLDEQVMLVSSTLFTLFAVVSSLIDVRLNLSTRAVLWVLSRMIQSGLRLH